MHEKELDLQYVILDLSGSNLSKPIYIYIVLSIDITKRRLTESQKNSGVPTVDTSGISFLIDLKKTTSKSDLEVLIILSPLSLTNYNILE